ncbi:hypothetical protein SCNRRL3882_0120 [Streptomyces chartreusis NRRL 3882]|uniref:Uncharacterized protein n=1 Tax=Streptomyces chartreusis NRRL 3882 TaxID=1079985 RepID=A0A2N9AZY0_STRCX|nr:hypothetical protein SCNRRL3882_0120 [Streptomyces chartreusis NRRL 3882]
MTLSVLSTGAVARTPLDGQFQMGDVSGKHVEHCIGCSGDGAGFDNFGDVFQGLAQLGGDGVAGAVHLDERLVCQASAWGSTRAVKPRIAPVATRRSRRRYPTTPRGNQ